MNLNGPKKLDHIEGNAPKKSDPEFVRLDDEDSFLWLVVELFDYDNFTNFFLEVGFFYQLWLKNKFFQPQTRKHVCYSVLLDP